MKISFILPTYNERDNIVIIIKSIIKCVSKLPYTYEILVIDDNSPDKTGKIVKENFYKNKQIKLFIRFTDTGLASAIHYGIKKATGDILFVMDTDFSHDPTLIPLMVSQLQSCDVVIGSRYAPGGGGEDKTKYMMSKLYNIFLRYFLRIDVSDFLFGYFCVRSDYIKTNHLLDKRIFSGFGDYFIRFVYYVNKSDGEFVEVPAIYKSRIHGVSKSNVAKMLFTYAETALELFLQDIFGLMKKTHGKG